MGEKLNFDLQAIKDDLIVGISECNKRGLIHSGKWLAELNRGLKIPNYKLAVPPIDTGISEVEFDDYCLAKSYFDCKEYDRAAYFTRLCTSPVPKFLNLYSMYMAKEKKRLDNSPDNTTLSGNAHLKDLSDLMKLLNEEYDRKKLDGYGMYLYGVVLKKLDLSQLAVTVFLESVHLVPFLWSAWIELAPLIQDEQKTEMAHLAHKAVEINKYRPETCCVIGNYYSIRGEHQKAILYFQRALKLNPKYLSAWTLMGHEFMELKNTNAAIQSYRQAVEVNRRDFRAWYGLGQAYEIIKMPFYGLYYYKTATQLRPYDSRMLVALGETYEKVGNNSNAVKCYQKACNVGDIEGNAMLKLGNLYEKIKDRENAVLAYKNFVLDERSKLERSALINAYLYLANYYLDMKNYEDATFYAHKILELDETKPEAKSILKEIADGRGKQLAVTPVDTVNEVNMNIANMECNMELETDGGALDETSVIPDDLDMSLC
ncbi:CLUMA_CG014394, isoform A [Clunio marinus]|uniref:CLUMA_CG014394, isoform A n=1 Tax=Clunio marinus TaxID=568069 RepID=A0A1J1IMC8_9DIPT|nr:CLUMA_CG014394, isoform A [Clunio marinus]